MDKICRYIRINYDWTTSPRDERASDCDRDVNVVQRIDVTWATRQAWLVTVTRLRRKRAINPAINERHPDTSFYRRQLVLHRAPFKFTHCCVLSPTWPGVPEGSTASIVWCYIGGASTTRWPCRTWSLPLHSDSVRNARANRTLVPWVRFCYWRIRRSLEFARHSACVTWLIISIAWRFLAAIKKSIKRNQFSCVYIFLVLDRNWWFFHIH